MNASLNLRYSLALLIGINFISRSSNLDKVESSRENSNPRAILDQSTGTRHEMCPNLQN